MGQVVAISINEVRAQLKIPVPQVMAVTNVGLEGDGHRGDWGRQVTCLRYESLLQSNEENDLRMGPGDFAENILIKEMDFSKAVAGSRLKLGEQVILEVSQVGKEDHPSVVLRNFGVSLLPKEGLFCRVIQGGLIKVGDSAEVM
ncbi:MAG: MOSC domain-containing protein [Syntrophomonadaceae bacterium]|nr:MOSC domain-containing protein [Syntrophomonadaceae bacterium]